MIRRNLPLLQYSLAVTLLVLALVSQTFNKTLGRPRSLPLDPVMSFEFADSAEIIEKLFLENEEPLAQFGKDILFSIQIDYGFIAAYSLFLMLVALDILETRKLIGWIAIFLAIAAGVFDILENLEMTRITHLMLDTAPLDKTILAGLKLFTWTKWFSCAIYVAIAGIHFWYRKGLLKVLAVISLGVPICGLIAAIANREQHGAKFIPFFVLGILLFIAVLVFRSLVRYLVASWK